MRDRCVHAQRGGQLHAGAKAAGAWLTVAGPEGDATLELSEGELLMAVQELAAVYADVVGANPASVAAGINRTLRNRTHAARTRRRESRGA